MENSELKIRQSIKKCHELEEENGKSYHIINDQFYTVVKESYFVKERPYHSLYNTSDMIYKGKRIEKGNWYV